MTGYLPRLGDVVQIKGVTGNTYTVLGMRDYYDHSPEQSEVRLLRADGTEAWDTLKNLVLIEEDGNTRAAYDYRRLATKNNLW